MSLRIDPDHSRFRDIVRGKIKQNLKKYISNGELIGRKGKDRVSIPLPQIQIPRFRFGDQGQGGVGQGKGQVGDAIGKGHMRHFQLSVVIAIRRQKIEARAFFPRGGQSLSLGTVID